jgi:hypothetical protein
MTSLTWYRSWPTEVPEGRAYVVDSMDRLPMSDCNYRTVPLWPDDEPGICLLEWDVALALPERERFAELALTHPDRVLVAPYTKPYHSGPHQQLHRMVDQTPIPEGQDFCHYFGFGCVYLPREMVREFEADYLKADRPRRQFSDVTFSLWHLKTYGRADVTWDVRPQHLHGD